MVVCDKTCLTCSNAGSTSCITCNENAFLSTGQCICNPGYYRDPSTSSCKSKDTEFQYIKIFLVCDITCLTCSNAGSSSCITCNANALLTSGQCTCNSGFYRDSSTSSCIGTEKVFNHN